MFRPRRSERGMALLLVVLIMIVVLAGGLAAVAISSSEIASARGYRTKQVTEACGAQALARIRAGLDEAGTSPAYDDTEGALSLGRSALTYRAGHYDGDGELNAVRELDPQSVDMSSLYEGENITNFQGAGGANALRVLTTSTVCGGSGFGAREMQLIFSFGAAMGSR